MAGIVLHVRASSYMTVIVYSSTRKMIFSADIVAMFYDDCDGSGTIVENIW